MDEFTEEYLEMFRRWNDIEGESNVREYWMAILINIIVVSVLGALSRISVIFSIIDGLYGLIIIIPLITLFTRRMHDINKSGWSWLWIFFPIVGWIYLIYLTIQPSK